MIGVRGNVIAGEEPKNQQNPDRRLLVGTFIIRRTKHVTLLHGLGITLEGPDGIFGRHRHRQVPFTSDMVLAASPRACLRLLCPVL